MDGSKPTTTSNNKNRKKWSRKTMYHLIHHMHAVKTSITTTTTTATATITITETETKSQTLVVLYIIRQLIRVNT